MAPWFLIAIGLVAAASSYGIRDLRRMRRASAVFAAIFSLLLAAVGASAFVPLAAVSVAGVWRVDALSGLLLGLLAVLSFTATATSVGYVGRETAHGALSDAQARLYFLCLPLFTLAMACALLADNLGALWGALEGTTLATTLLVALYRKDASVEAAWKYVILCSIGISLGLLGMLMSVAAAVSGAHLDPGAALSLAALRAHAGAMDPTLAKWAFVLVLVGLGTKVGFVPMHAWLPDAHSKTPSPVSALLSGMLLNVALYATLRFKTVIDVAAGAGWSDRLYLGFGVLSVAVAALFLLQQRNYKRMLAYSSVEHMGLTAFMIGLGPLGLVPATIHLIGHALLKSALFFSSGEILLAYGTTKIESVRGMARRLPWTAALFSGGLLLLLGVPFSPLFASEATAIAAGMVVAPAWTAVVLLALTVAAVGMVRSLVAMLYGEDSTDATRAAPERWRVGHAMAATHLVLALAIGGAVAVSPALHGVVTAVVAVLTPPSV